MTLRCPKCGTHIFREIKEGELITCYRCFAKLEIKEGKAIIK